MELKARDEPWDKGWIKKRMELCTLPKELCTDWCRVTAYVCVCACVSVCVYMCVSISADVNSLAIFSVDQLDEGSLVPRCEILLLVKGA